MLSLVVALASLAQAAVATELSAVIKICVPTTGRNLDANRIDCIDHNRGNRRHDKS